MKKVHKLSMILIFAVIALGIQSCSTAKKGCGCGNDINKGGYKYRGK